MNARNLITSVMSLTLLTLSVWAADAVKLDGIKCVLNPKMAAKPDQSVDYLGGKVYFCCAECPKSFDAAKHAVAANHQLVATKQAKQMKCPITGESHDTQHTVKVADVEVAFCCLNCKGEVADADKESQLKMVFGNEAFRRAFKVEKK
jgi:hypothetical protein